MCDLIIQQIYLLVRLRLVDLFFFNDTATTEIYTLSLHDALPISNAWRRPWPAAASACLRRAARLPWPCRIPRQPRSEEHTSELQSRHYLLCPLLLEKKKTPDRLHSPPSPPGYAQIYETITVPTSA